MFILQFLQSYNVIFNNLILSFKFFDIFITLVCLEHEIQSGIFQNIAFQRRRNSKTWNTIFADIFRRFYSILHCTYSKISQHKSQ